jgi:excisionase family DNA binding protein
VTALLTSRVVAQRLGVSTETVLRWVRRGELPAIRLPNGGLRFGEQQLEEWLEGRATPAQGAAVLTTTTTADAAPAMLPSKVLTTEDKEH